MKSEQIIMVVDKQILFQNNYFEGFLSQDKAMQDKVNFESRILNNYSYMKRGLAEVDPNHKQPVGYGIIVNLKLKKVFVYQRSKKDINCNEKRLQGKFSIGVGGHIEKFDTEKGNPLHTSMLRELNEEVHLEGDVKLKVLGYINEDLDDVGKVHFGILYLIETTSFFVNPKDPEIDNGKLMTIEEFEKICTLPNSSVEKWSTIALLPLKEYIENFSEVSGM